MYIKDKGWKFLDQSPKVLLLRILVLIGNWDFGLTSMEIYLMKIRLG
jgi:hypothetical protein